VAWNLVVEAQNDGSQAGVIDSISPDPDVLLGEEVLQVKAAKDCLKAALAGMFGGAAFRASLTGSSWNGGGTLNFSITAIPPDQVAALAAAGITPIGKLPPVMEPPALS
jgi:hypothetical protein